jgi:hypothetical protein
MSVKSPVKDGLLGPRLGLGQVSSSVLRGWAAGVSPHLQCLKTIGVSPMNDPRSARRRR